MSLAVYGSGCPRDRIRQCRVPNGHVVERAVRLYMLKLHSMSQRHGHERTDLVCDKVFDLSRGGSNVASAESNEIGKARVSSHRHAVRTRERNRFTHGRRVASVEAARDAGRGDRGHELRVLAELVDTERFADVGIQIQTHHGADTRVILPTFLGMPGTYFSGFS